MKHELAPLPYSLNALVPYISEETMTFHYEKHHKAYVTNLNNLLPGTQFESMTLEEIIQKSSGEIFNNAAQIWNHDFFWKSMTPGGGELPEGKLLQLVASKWGSFEGFKEDFKKKAISNFGSGWTWLVLKPDKSLDITNTSNGNNPLTTEDQALLTLDVWEHAYYIDYRNLRPSFVDVFLNNLANWGFAQKRCLELL